MEHILRVALTKVLYLLQQCPLSQDKQVLRTALQAYLSTQEQRQ